ncbi:MAG: TIM barrel protein [Planctomycetes bacterium]|nr:TIM barrel protein [Planctomycetota bacterium]
MAILTHGSDLTLAPTIKPVVKQTDGTVRTAAGRLSSLGFRSVQLDATLPGIRPRDLGVRDRKDLSALLTRASMSVAGIDFFIPVRHFVEAEHLDRAMAAALSVVELAADLGRVPVSLMLPIKTMSDDAKRALVDLADGRGVRLAVHAEDQADELAAWIEQVDMPALGAAVDPAAVLARGKDPVAAAMRFGKRLAVARLCDIGGTGEQTGDDENIGVAGVRCPVGEGDLDVVGYRVAVDLASHRAGAVVLDLRGMENPLNAAAVAQHAWGKAAFTA